MMLGPVFERVGRCVLAGEEVEYQLFRSSRRTLGVTVEPGGHLVVTAPDGVGVGRIESILRRRRSWIRRQRRMALDLPRAPGVRTWVSGETHKYLGRQYRLKVQVGRPSVHLQGAFFLVSVPRREPSLVRAGMERWYREHALAVFQRRARTLIETTARLRLRDVPPLRVKRLAKRWGSCSPNGALLMSVDAVRLPVGCVDYLLLHELCHGLVPNHSARFWRLLETCMPDWERWRERLARFEL